MAAQNSILSYFKNKDEQLKRKFQPTLSPVTPVIPKLPLESNQQNITKKIKPSLYIDMDWFLHPKDSNGHPYGDPLYDPSLISIPSKTRKSFTPSVKRYFEIKAQWWDSLLFYKVGKFYEVYDKDAQICHTELGLQYMRGQERPHVGVPEKTFSKYAGKLVAKGFKVARVDQVETVKEMQKRVKREKGPKVVKREVTSILTPGANLDLDFGEENDSDSVYLLSITETEINEKTVEIGICFCNSKTSEITFGNFKDDPNRTQLRTLLTSLRPGETVEPQSPLSPETSAAILSICPSTLRSSSPSMHSKNIIDIFQGEIPPIISELSLNKSAFKAFSQCFTYLCSLQVAEEILAVRKMGWYRPGAERSRLEMDSATIENLHLFRNEVGGVEGTLFQWIDRCSTAFGRRRLKKWLISPLKNVKDINERLEAIRNLLEIPLVCDSARKELRKLPDVENSLAKIAGFCRRERKAIFYENVDLVYLKVFDGLIKAFKAIGQIFQSFRNERNGIDSKLLKELIFALKITEINAKLGEISSKIDLEKSISQQRIMPKDDSILEKLKAEENAIESKLKGIVDRHRKEFADDSIRLFSSSASALQLEVSIATSLRLPLNDYREVSRTKSRRRLKTAELDRLSMEREELADRTNSVEGDLFQGVLSQFCGAVDLWNSAADLAARLDCFLALYRVSGFSCGQMARPEFLEGSRLELRQSWHPCATAEGDFVANDILLGGDSKGFLLVTGPNMGGKSTLLRQVCVSVILAQVGCYVPAGGFRLGVVDKVFTRIGANDAILAEKSTFLVELEQTAAILKNASANSLVVLDELGRGTSTLDGTAIAFAVCEELSAKIGCLTLFSTHYHVLSEKFLRSDLVDCYHMAFHKVEDRIICLYSFRKGICPQSHGISCAILAGIDRSITLRAEKWSNDFKLNNK